MAEEIHDTKCSKCGQDQFCRYYHIGEQNHYWFCAPCKKAMEQLLVDWCKIKASITSKM